MAVVMQMRLPAGSEQQAPGYAANSFRLGHRVLALARVAQMSCYVVAVRVRQSLQRVDWQRRGSDACLEALERDGIFASRLSVAVKQGLADEARPWFGRLEAVRAAVPRGAREYCHTQLVTARNDAPGLYAAVEGALGEAGILSSVRNYLGCRAELRSVALQINDEHDRFWRAHFEDRGVPVPSTVFFHIDNTYGVVKAMIYLSEVGGTNGPFSYVPGTHRVDVGWFEALVLRAVDIWIDVYPEERHLFAALPRLLRRKAKFGDDLDPADAQGKWLLDHERVMTSKDGDVFIFDVKGVHRGGMVKNGERRVIQVMMS
ncbi:phytanoyl-CoA dioxygenase family protein [Reyranella sp.]|uniref:phytanoyl-CoA dioxygenase family protein n=1 Tax=Reyranella sp. TaxID=1929291 RepID=UPI003D0D86DE